MCFIQGKQIHTVLVRKPLVYEQLEDGKADEDNIKIHLMEINFSNIGLIGLAQYHSQ